MLINEEPMVQTRTPQTHGVREGWWGQGGAQTYRILKFIVGSFGLDFILLTEGSIQSWRDQLSTYCEEIIISQFIQFI
jgi:hypothetical protein